MPTIEAEAFAIAIVTLPGDRYSQLRLDRDGKIYDFIRVFSDRQSDRARQYLQQLPERDPAATTDADLYLLVREQGHYSLWRQSLAAMPTSNNGSDLLALQQASSYLFQELWVQWEDLLGNQQLQIFAEQLVTTIPQLESRADVDRLLNLDPAAANVLADWTAADWLAFDRHLYQLTQKKMGERFGAKVIAEIIDSLPEHLAIALTDIVNTSA